MTSDDTMAVSVLVLWRLSVDYFSDDMHDVLQRVAAALVEDPSGKIMRVRPPGAQWLDYARSVKVRDQLVGILGLYVRRATGGTLTAYRRTGARPILLSGQLTNLFTVLLAIPDPNRPIVSSGRYDTYPQDGDRCYTLSQTDRGWLHLKKEIAGSR
jgi:hypothetical protein